MADPTEMTGENFVIKNKAQHEIEHNFLHRVGNVAIAATQTTLGAAIMFLAALSWIATAAIVAAIYLVPEFRTMPMPVFDRGTVLDFFVRFGYPGLMVLVLSNTLSAQFAPSALHRLDYAISCLCATAVCLVAIIVLILDVGKNALHIDDLIFLGTVAAFGIIDVVVNQHVMARERERRELEMGLLASESKPVAPVISSLAVQPVSASSEDVVIHTVREVFRTIHADGQVTYYPPEAASLYPVR